MPGPTQSWCGLILGPNWLLLTCDPLTLFYFGVTSIRASSLLCRPLLPASDAASVTALSVLPLSHTWLPVLFHKRCLLLLLLHVLNHVHGSH